ncbi:hypothetical protein GGR52DRAFT_206298 [Hypoxylon sp. FL1284]|nr:hypothetical protein GGR52DRAFT_206298 [Hypoxylon sp. FL1284]
MKLSSCGYLLSLMVGAVVGSSQLPAFYDEIPSGYTLGNLTWVGNIIAGGPEVSFTGPSLQDIEAQIRQANPSFAWPDHNTTDLSVLPQKQIDHLTCDLADFYWAVKFRIADGIEYLKGKSGQCHIGPGPRFCSRISCSFSSAIFWCNDNDSDLWIDCGLWAQYAQNVVDACTIDDASQHVKGQQFDTDNWNIIVGFTMC